MLRFLAAIPLLFCLSACGNDSTEDVPLPEKKPGDADALQGRWFGELVDGPKDGGEWEFFVEDKYCELYHGDGRQWYKGTIIPNPNIAPAQIMLNIRESHDPRFEGMFMLGIYDVEGDELRLCWNISKGGKRPVNFEPARNVWSLELVRIEDEE
ncbi:MAG: hypothetical protein ACYTAF_12110 [Planctomycetota bacterium]|jgi:uncharacterized protein (TIGR03067 family)